MARSEIITKLSLDEWARFMGIHPLHFNGVAAVNEDTNARTICKRVWFQHEWQDADRVGRDAIAQAILAAEQEIEQYLGYRLLPSWEREEWQPTQRPIRPETVSLSMSDVRGYGRIVKARWGHFISGGVEAVALLDATVAVAYSDKDGDGYQELAEITITTSATADPSEIEVHLPDGDFATEYDEKNRVRPIAVKVTDNGNGTYTYDIRCRREQLVLWDKLTTLPPVNAIAGDADNTYFAAEVEIWRHYNDPSTQATIMWERPPDCATCTDGTCGSCAYGSQTACLMARADPKLSLLAYSPATWNADLSTFGPAEAGIARDPDVVRLFYRAGLRNRARETTMGARFSGAYPNQVMDPFWARIVAQFAASKLDRPVCDCGYIRQQIEMWNQDLAYTSGAEQTATFTISSKDLRSPFGTRRGAIMAWRAVSAPGAALGESVIY